MADRLTQLQDCLDDLATQMFASLRYIQTNHSYATIQGQPDQNPHPPTETHTTNSTLNARPISNGATAVQAGTEPNTQTTAGSNEESLEPRPDSPKVFQASLRELARDLIMKEQQIEYLIGVLPGIGTSEADQAARINTLELELRETEEKRKTARHETESMLSTLEQLGANCKRTY